MSATTILIRNAHSLQTHRSLHQNEKSLLGCIFVPQSIFLSETADGLKPGALFQPRTPCPTWSAQAAWNIGFMSSYPGAHSK